MNSPRLRRYIPIAMCVLPLEFELSGDLNYASIDCGALNDAKCGVCDAGIGSGEVDPVESVEEVSAKLDVVTLEDLRCLGQRQINSLLTWVAQ